MQQILSVEQLQQTRILSLWLSALTLTSIPTRNRSVSFLTGVQVPVDSASSSEPDDHEPELKFDQSGQRTIYYCPELQSKLVHDRQGNIHLVLSDGL